MQYFVLHTLNEQTAFAHLLVLLGRVVSVIVGSTTGCSIIGSDSTSSTSSSSYFLLAFVDN